jgi:hypothetical protein
MKDEEEVTLITYTCDGCDKTQEIVKGAEELPFGYHGSVVWISAHGGSNSLEFWACRAACLQKAIRNVCERQR